MTVPVVAADEAGLARAVAALRTGGLVAFPTETVYGLGADADRPEAVERVFRAKGRPADHPLIVHVADAGALDRWAAEVPPAARALAAALWPGPLTLLLARADHVADVVTGGRPTVGLRVPDHPVALALLRAFGGGVAAPSANRFGGVSPTTAAHVVDDLGERLDEAHDLVVDGGPCGVGVESTIVDLSGPAPEVLRPGGVTGERLADVLGAPVRRWAGEGAARAPGMLAVHYAPRARVVVVADLDAVPDAVAAARAAGATAVGLLAPTAAAALDVGIVELEPAGPAERYARVLYDRLRQADRLGLDVLVAVPPEAAGIGEAVRDRLLRAAAGGT